ncbi:MAG: PilZ domain-containing protein [Nitrospiraceae bacterium]|nr:MAG: PilZ domain-containing protein [Nitrospiraceae bacterium]
MERRRSRRKSVSLPARIESPEAAYEGIIENVSEHGLCMETDSQHLLKASMRFQPGAEYEVRFHTPSGNEIRLRCKVTWSYKVAPQGLKKKIGMEIVFPPPSFVQFYRQLGEKKSS